MKKLPGIIGPLLLIAAGFILLLVNLDYLPRNIFLTIVWHFWPGILILIGLDILVRQTESRFYYTAGVLLGFFIIAGIIILASGEVGPLSRNGPFYPFNVHRDGVALPDSGLVEKVLIGTDLAHEDLEGKDLKNALLIGADLAGANLQRTDMSGTLSIGSNMNGADMQYSDLSGSFLLGVNLNGANLTNSDLNNSFLLGTNLDGTILCGAKLNNALRLGVETTISTVCPDCTAGPCW